MANKQAIARLTKDLKELMENPLSGTNAMPLEDNLMVWHCTTIVPEGNPYAGTPLHWVMEFDHDYPNKAPKAYFLTHIAYWNGAQAHDDKGRTYLCLSLFGNFDKVHTEWAGQVGHGWSSSYTVSTILVTFQSALMDQQFLATDNANVQRTSKEAWALHCKDCGHSGEKPEKYFPKIPDDVDVLAAQMKNKANIKDNNFVCYATRDKLGEDGVVLGYGLNVRTNKQGRVSSMTSPCEYLSHKAFSSGTRASTNKSPLTHWIPIVINDQHWKRALPVWQQQLKGLAQNKKDTEPRQALAVLSSLMSGVVVDVMNNRSDTNASERFLEGYYAFYRLLLEYKDALQEHCDSEVEKFLSGTEKRSKNVFSNLGEFLIVCALSKKRWSDIATAFQEECDCRNVFWYVQGNYNNPPKHPELADVKREDPNRYQKVFTATEVSRNLVCFQVMFMRFIEDLDVKTLDANNGIPSDEVKSQLKVACNNITQFVTWKEYLQWNDMPIVTNDERNKQLVEAVKLSNQKGYTKTGGGGFMGGVQSSFRGGRRGGRRRGY